MWEVVVVGAGVCGASVAYHLVQAGVKDIICLDMGEAGRGREKATPGRVAPGGVHLLPEDEREFQPQVSGSVTFANEEGPGCIKMITIIPPCTPLSAFVDHHGSDGAASYITMASFGRDLEIELARQVLPNPNTQVKQLGSLMVCTAAEEAEMRKEFDELRALGCECEWWDTPRVIEVHGAAAGFAFGIFFPRDAIIDSTLFARSLLESVRSTVKLVENCSEVIFVGSNSDRHGLVRMADGTEIVAKKVVVATGGLFVDAVLAGLLRPCYSYLMVLPHQDPGKAGGMPGGQRGSSPNFWTLGFNYDWCVADGYVRVSGEDHFSALKSPRLTQRTQRLLQWTQHKYPYLKTDSNMRVQVKHGVYSETPDAMPLVGSVRDDSPVFYMVGCNANGQSALSAIASLAPGLLGYAPMNDLQREFARLTCIRRFHSRQVADDARAAKL